MSSALHHRISAQAKRTARPRPLAPARRPPRGERTAAPPAGSG
jgi:hypothetical protein